MFRFMLVLSVVLLAGDVYAGCGGKSGRAGLFGRKANSMMMTGGGCGSSSMMASYQMSSYQAAPMQYQMPMFKVSGGCANCSMQQGTVSQTKTPKESVTKEYINTCAEKLVINSCACAICPNGVCTNCTCDPVAAATQTLLQAISPQEVSKTNLVAFGP